MRQLEKTCISFDTDGLQNVQGHLRTVDELQTKIAERATAIQTAETAVSDIRSKIENKNTEIAGRAAAYDTANALLEAAIAEARAAVPESDQREIEGLTSQFEAANGEYRSVLAEPDPTEDDGSGWRVMREAFRQMRSDKFYVKNKIETQLREKKEAVNKAIEKRVADARSAVQAANSVLVQQQNAQYEVSRLKHQLGTAETNLQNHRDWLASYNGDLLRAQKALDPLFQSLPFEILRDVAALQQSGSKVWTPIETDRTYPQFDPFKMRHRAAFIRGELNVECDCFRGCVYDAYEHASYPLIVRLWRDEAEHWICYHRAHFNHDILNKVIDGLIPPSHRHHRLASMQPFGGSSITLAAQAKYIEAIPSDFEDVRGWFTCGPGGSAKTSWASASLLDVATFRVCLQSEQTDQNRHDDDPKFDISMWRVKVPDYLDQMEEYKRREFKRNKRDSIDDPEDEWGRRREPDAIKPPQVTPDAIRASCRETGFRPILWLEEIHFMSPTTNRRTYLHKLIDAVYELDGVVITTTNPTVKRLTALLDGEDEDEEYPITRRLVGTNDMRDSFLVWELHAFQKKGATEPSRGAKKKRAAAT